MFLDYSEMVSKQICFAAFRHITNHSSIIHTRINFTYLRNSQKCLLHTKVFDKDVGLDARRQENSKLYTEDCEQQSIDIEERQDDPAGRQIKPGATDYIKPYFEENPDVFGNASLNEEDPDPGDEQEDEFLRNPPSNIKQLRPIDYARQIKDLLREKRLKEAINVLEVKMLKEDRAKPDHYIYNLLISGCAKAGYSRKAFNLFTKMKQRGLRVTGGTYTSLINACANAPTAGDGLSKINALREIMAEKGYIPNVKNYNAMIKAYGRCGDLKNAYQIADEMMDNNLPVDTETFNFLLQACASDHKFGFRHCLLTWHRMLKRGVVPDFYSFSTVLRCTRDCSFGDIETMKGALKEITEMSQSQGIDKISQNVDNFALDLELKSDQSKLVPAITSKIDCEEYMSVKSVRRENYKNPFSHASEVVEDVPAENQKMHSTVISISSNQLDAVKSNTDTMFAAPNLLSPNPHLGSLLHIEEVKLPHDKLLLLGGLNGFLEQMKAYKITPDIETFTLLLEVIPPTYAAEKQLISYVRKIGLKSDIDFFNILIKKRSMRFDYDGAKEVLSMIKTAGLHPDIVTYGVLALGCETVESARDLIEQMRAKGVRMNIQILGAMLRQGCSKKAFDYICEILQMTLEENVKPNEMFLRHLNTFYRRCARAIDARHPYTKGKDFKKGHAKFCKKLNLWYEERGIAGLKLEDAIKKIQERPYQQYTEKDVEGLEENKNEKLSRKEKFRKYIKKIKLKDLKDDDADDKSQALLKDQN